ncbi:MAG: class I SAM-dependent methyltransferase [Clostridiales bacterium]|nr:class I SAM-dependent methyltransferase [Clostridiales bacterium]
MSQAAAFLSQNILPVVSTKERIVDYWNRRSRDFARLHMRELASPIAGRWMEEICGYLPRKKILTILDVGTGSGFFSFLLSDFGYEVIGIDLTPSMIEEAQKAGRLLGSKALFMVMDAEKLSFEDETFDLVISRNLTWTLPNPKTAYGEWFRVLKQGGLLLNFDGNYGKEDFTADEDELPEDHAHRRLEKELCAECNRIKEQLEISYHQRPAWDVKILQQAGFEKLDLDFGVSRRIYTEVDEFYNPVPLFRIAAVK